MPDKKGKKIGEIKDVDSIPNLLSVSFREGRESIRDH